MLKLAQLLKNDAITEEMILKTESDINHEVFDLNEITQISDLLSSKKRSTFGLTAWLYGLAKVHKDETPILPVYHFRVAHMRN